MSIQECEILVKALEEQLALLDFNDFDEYKRIMLEIEALRKEAYSNLTAWDHVCIARSPKRPKATDYINELFTNFIEFHGDYYYGDDRSIISGIGLFEDIPVTVIAQAKGKNIEENIDRNFSSTNPEGFRKALRIAKQAEKFNRPIITIVDTSGAFPGRGAEERGQSRAIASNLAAFSNIKVPVIAIVIGEGGSGGALALSVADRIMMLEYAVYSILSPEGFSSILFKDSTRVVEAAEKMKLTAKDLYNKNIIDTIIKEPFGGAQNDFKFVINQIKEHIHGDLTYLQSLDLDELLEKRYKKFRDLR